MIKIADIRDGESLRKWLIDWPQENGLDEDAVRAVSVTIAHRAAMRVLPLLWQWTLTDGARNSDLTALLVLRCNLISGVAALVPTPEIKKAAINGTNAAFAANANAAFAANAAVNATFAAAADAAAAKSVAANATIAANSTAMLWDETRTDCEQIAGKQDIFAAALWKSRGNPFEPRWHEVKSRITDPEWSFWIKWYDDALAGNPPNWDMLEQIALIESEVWEEGVEAVAERIALISEKYELLSEVQATRVSLAELCAKAKALVQRSHNNPPELVDTDMSVIRSVEIIWTELGQAEKELEKPDPSPSRLRRISAALLEAGKTVATYCAELSDIALKNAAKEVGSTGAKWTIRVLAVSYTAQNPGIQSLAARIYEFAGNLPNLP